MTWHPTLGAFQGPTGVTFRVWAPYRKRVEVVLNPGRTLSRIYGIPDDLRRLADRAHNLGLAVLLDVVYNRFGPDGAY